MVRIFLIEKSSNNNDNINFENIYLDKWSLSRDSSGKVTISGEELSDTNNPAVEQLINKITALPASSDDCEGDKKSELELAAKLIEEGNANITITGECNLHIDSVDTLSNLTATSNSGYAAITIDSTQNIMTLRASSNSEACNVVVQTNEEIGNISGAGGSALNINMDKVDYIDSIAATDSSTINLSAESKVNIKDYTGSIIAVEHAEDQVEEHTTIIQSPVMSSEDTDIKKDQSPEAQVEAADLKKDQSPETQVEAADLKKDQSPEAWVDAADLKKDQSPEEQVEAADLKKDQSPEASPFISIAQVNNTANNNPENKALDIASDPLLAEVNEVLEAEIKRTLPLVKAEDGKNAQASNSNVNIAPNVVTNTNVNNTTPNVVANTNVNNTTPNVVANTNVNNTTPNVATNANVNNTTPNVATNANVNNTTPNVATNANVNTAPKAEANVNSEAAKITANAASTSVYDIYNDKIRFEDKSIKPPTLDSIKSVFNTFKP
jgi:hypothetical protein